MIPSSVFAFCTCRSSDAYKLTRRPLKTRIRFWQFAIQNRGLQVTRDEKPLRRGIKLITTGSPHKISEPELNPETDGRRQDERDERRRQKRVRESARDHEGSQLVCVDRDGALPVHLGRCHDVQPSVRRGPQNGRHARHLGREHH